MLPAPANTQHLVLFIPRRSAAELLQVVAQRFVRGEELSLILPFGSQIHRDGTVKAFPSSPSVLRPGCFAPRGEKEPPHKSSAPHGLLQLSRIFPAWFCSAAQRAGGHILPPPLISSLRD